MTSVTQISTYEALGVPEIWRDRSGQLKISILRGGKYVESPVSLAVPNFVWVEPFSKFVNRGADVPMSQARKEFRQVLGRL